MEEKISNSESENQVLRQQALAVSPTGKALSARPRTVIIQVRITNMKSLLSIIVYGDSQLDFMHDMQRIPENGNTPNGEAKIGSVRGHCSFHEYISAVNFGYGRFCLIY